MLPDSLDVFSNLFAKELSTSLIIFSVEFYYIGIVEVANFFKTGLKDISFHIFIHSLELAQLL